MKGGFKDAVADEIKGCNDRDTLFPEIVAFC